jgi:hypothetical protein
VLNKNLRARLKRYLKNGQRLADDIKASFQEQLPDSRVLYGGEPLLAVLTAWPVRGHGYAVDLLGSAGLSPEHVEMFGNALEQAGLYAITHARAQEVGPPVGLEDGAQPWHARDNSQAQALGQLLHISDGAQTSGAPRGSGVQQAAVTARLWRARHRSPPPRRLWQCMWQCMRA